MGLQESRTGGLYLWTTFIRTDYASQHYGLYRYRRHPVHSQSDAPFAGMRFPCRDVKSIYNTVKSVYDGVVFIPLNQRHSRFGKMFSADNPVCDVGLTMREDGKIAVASVSRRLMPYIRMREVLPPASRHLDRSAYGFALEEAMQTLIRWLTSHL